MAENKLVRMMEQEIQANDPDAPEAEPASPAEAEQAESNLVRLVLENKAEKDNKNQTEKEV